MSYRLYVQCTQAIQDTIAADGEVGFNWVLLDAGGDVQARGAGDLRQSIEQVLAQNALDNVNMIGLIPGDEVLFCAADIPAKQSRFIRQALPFAIEEQLAQDVETMHLALGSRIEQGYRVAAIDREAMARWSALFSDWDNTRLTAIYPDAALLPAEGRNWAICLMGEFALLASGRGEWLRMNAVNLAMFAHSLAMPSEDDVISEINVALYGEPEELEAHQALEGTLAGDSRIALSQEILEVAPVELLAHSHYRHRCDPINLCEGDFAPGNRSSGAWRPWRPLIAVACTWFVLQIGLEIGMGVYQQQQAQAIESRAMAIYQQSFPQDRRTTAGTVKRVVQGQLRQLGSQGQSLDFLSLIKQAGQQYASLPGMESVTFNSINYTQSRGELVVDLRADSFNKLSALRNGLVQRGLEADIGSVVNESTGARGRLTISGG